MTKNIKTFLIGIMTFAMICTFCACNNGMVSIDSAALDNAGGKSQGILRLSADTAVSRSAVASVSIDEFTRIILKDNKYVSDNSADSTDDSAAIFGSWDVTGDVSAYQQLKQASILIDTGEWELALIGVCKNAIYGGTTNLTITEGVNNIKFTLVPLIRDSEYGYGSLDVNISFPAENVKSVTAGLYTMDEVIVLGYGDETTDIKKGGSAAYTKEDIPSGDYVVIFRFYADTDMKQLIGTYREYTCITANMTSKSKCQITSLSSMYKIEYRLDDGSFAGGYTKPGSYTRMSDTIVLPTAENVVKSSSVAGVGYTFGGWYDNVDFSGDPATEIPSGSAGDKTFYAKWDRYVVVTFKSGDGTQELGTMNVYADETTCLRSAAALKLTNEKKHLIGWAGTTGQTTPLYKDGGEINIGMPKSLYAVWSASDINPENENDPIDTDGDGLSDWDELHTYYTDPSNPDTDGDGWKDGEEISGMYNVEKNSFNPLIADMPYLEVLFDGNPQIEYIYSMSSTQSATDTVAENTGETGSASNTTTNAHSNSMTHGWNVKFGESFKFGKDDNGVFGLSEFSLSSEQGTSGNYTSGDTYTYSSQASQGWSKSWTNTKSKTATEGKTVTGGILTINAKFRNPSNVAYTAKSVTVSVNRIPNNTDYYSDTEVIGIASFIRSGEMTIQPGATTGSFTQVIKIESLDTLEKLLKWSNGIRLEVSSCVLTRDKGGDFTDAMTNVAAKTAQIYIDWGKKSMPARSYPVSVKNLYNIDAGDAESLYNKPDLDWIFQNVLNYQKNSQAGYTLTSNGNLESIFGISNSADRKDGAWYIIHTYTNNMGNKETLLYSSYSDGIAADKKWQLSDIKINAGDEVSIIYSTDKDNDGVPLSEETVYGTSDESADSDGDGLSDFDEIYGWYGMSWLDSIYTSNNKCHTNPMNPDTDGDDLPDYSDNDALQDSDPLEPKLKNIAALEYAKYRASQYDTEKNITFSTGDNPAATISGLYEYLYLDIKPKYDLLSQVHYRMSDTEDWREISSRQTNLIKLNIGANKISIRITAPDMTTTKILTLNVQSEFNRISGASMYSPKFSGGKIDISWNGYSDKRANESFGGYILYLHRGNNDMYNTGKPSRNSVTTAASFRNGSEYKNNDYILKMSQDDMTRGTATVYVNPNTHYDVGLFAYSGSNDNASYKITCLYATNFDTAKTQYATLKLYAHYVYGVNEHDPGTEAEYYWSFTDNTNYLGMNDLSRGSKKHTIDLEDGDCYSFQDRQTHGSATAKFSDKTQILQHSFDRNKNYTFDVSWNVKEDDTTNTDNLGTVTCKFSYDSSTDKWSCSWSASGGDGDGAKKNEDSCSVMAKGRTSSQKWKLYNSSKGEVEFHFDIGWDE